MSYSIQVWESPVPDSVQSAESIAVTLHGDKTKSARPKVDALAAKLWALYPRDIDGDDEDVYWEDVFAHEPQPRRVLESFTLSLEHVEEIVPVLARLANENGLVAFDPQIGSVYLPSGRRLGADAAPAPAHRETERKFDAKSATREFIEEMSEGLAPYGFRWKKVDAHETRFVRYHEEGWQSIEPFLNFSGGALEVDFSLEAFLDAADKILGVEPRKDALKNYVALCRFMRFMSTILPAKLASLSGSGSVLRANTFDAVRALAQQCVGILVDHVLPRLAAYTSFLEYGRLAAQRDNSAESEVFREQEVIRVAAMAQAAPDRFESLAAKELATLDAKLAKIRAETPGRADLIGAVQLRKDQVGMLISKLKAAGK